MNHDTESLADITEEMPDQPEDSGSIFDNGQATDIKLESYGFIGVLVSAVIILFYDYIFNVDPNGAKSFSWINLFFILCTTGFAFYAYIRVRKLKIQTTADATWWHYWFPRHKNYIISVLREVVETKNIVTFSAQDSLGAAVLTPSLLKELELRLAAEETVQAQAIEDKFWKLSNKLLQQQDKLMQGCLTMGFLGTVVGLFFLLKTLKLSDGDNGLIFTTFFHDLIFGALLAVSTTFYGVVAGIYVRWIRGRLDRNFNALEGSVMENIRLRILPNFITPDFDPGTITVDVDLSPVVNAVDRLPQAVVSEIKTAIRNWSKQPIVDIQQELEHIIKAISNKIVEITKSNLKIFETTVNDIITRFETSSYNIINSTRDLDNAINAIVTQPALLSNHTKVMIKNLITLIESNIKVQANINELTEKIEDFVTTLDSRSVLIDGMAAAHTAPASISSNSNDRIAAEYTIELARRLENTVTLLNEAIAYKGGSLVIETARSLETLVGAVEMLNFAVSRLKK